MTQIKELKRLCADYWLHITPELKDVREIFNAEQQVKATLLFSVAASSSMSDSQKKEFERRLKSTDFKCYKNGMGIISAIYTEKNMKRLVQTGTNNVKKKPNPVQKPTESVTKRSETVKEERIVEGVKIERGIPIPMGRETDVRAKKILKAMAVGDSYIKTTRTETKTAASGMIGLEKRVAKSLKIKLRAKRVDSTKIRIWRVA